MPDTVPQPKSDASKFAEMADLVKRLCLALSNVEMYAADHPLAKKGIAEAFDALCAVLQRRHQPLVVSASGNKIVLEGLPLEDKNPLVSKFAARLEALHVNHLVFERVVTADEFHAFFRVLGKGPRVINEQGGLAAQMTEAAIAHITLREITYVMVTGDEKVVSKDARVVDEHPLTGTAADAEMVRYMVSKVLEKADEQKWLLSEIKNNPQKVADLITESIGLASSRMEMGQADANGPIETLLKNIQIVTQGLSAPGADEPGNVNTADLEKSILTLESEVRARSSKLMSSKVAQGFLNEILTLVTSYSDRVKAKQISGEFLKGESNLKRTEKLLRDLIPQDVSKDQFLEKISAMLVQRGMTPADVTNLAALATEKPKPPRKPRKPYSQAVFEGVSKRLKDLSIASSSMQEVTESLSAFIEDKAREKAGDVRIEADTLRRDVTRRTRALEDLPLGILLWDSAGQVEFINAAGKQMLQIDLGAALSPALRERLTRTALPLAEPPDLAQGPALSAFEVRLLLCALRTITDAQGQIYGVVLSQDSAPAHQ